MLQEHVLATQDDTFNREVVGSCSKILCNVHGPDEEVKYFCLIHDVPCCEKCKLIYHRGCQGMKSLKYIASKSNAKDEGQKLLPKSKRLEKKLRA